ncbi:hypothetical protein MKX01_034290 [Papaver californicum]|nr:hypothetical protein MKX01_034290 [Papaver californicum]
MRTYLNPKRGFSSSSSIPWISPLQVLKPSSPKPDPPPLEFLTSLEEEQSQRRTKPKFITHGFVITIIKNEKDPQRALEIFNRASKQRGFYHSHNTYFILLHKLAQCKKFNAVDSVLHQMRYETCKFYEGLFLNLMTHFSKSSLHERTLDMFYLIQPIVRKKPSLKAISTCLSLLVGSGRLDLARKLLADSRKIVDLKLNTCIYNILVKHHCIIGNLDMAFKVLKEAMEVFEEMVSKHKILPDALTYNILINGFCHGGNVDRARKIIEFMRKNGCKPNVISYSFLMNGLSKEGRLEEVKEIFDEMRNSGTEVDAVGYTTLISCFCRVERVDEAVNVFREMREKDCRVDSVASNLILGGLCREKRFDEALEMLEYLSYEGVCLNKASYRIVLNFLCKEREMEKVMDLLGLMLVSGFKPHFATSTEILLKLCEEGKVVDATMALRGLLEIGFKPEQESWAHLVNSLSRDRKLVIAFELLDDLGY